MTKDEKIFVLTNAFVNLSRMYHDFAHVAFRGVNDDEHHVEELFEDCTESGCINNRNLISNLHQDERKH